MKNALKYAVLALGPIVLIVGIVMFISGGNKNGLADSALFYNVYTGESQRISIREAGRSVLADDQGRRCRFIVVGEDGNTNVSRGEPMYIREHDRYTFDKYLADGRLDPEKVKVDPDTYIILQ